MAKSTTTTDAPAPAPEGNPATTGLPADDYKTEQEKGGPDPVSAPVEPTKAEPVTIAPNEPYPTGGAKAEQGVPQNAEPGNAKSGDDQK